MCRLGELWHLHCPNLSVGGCEWPYSGRASCLGLVPALHLELLGQALGICDPELE